MKKSLIFLTGILLLGLGGCGKNPTQTQPTEEMDGVAWQAERQKMFGTYDYLSIEEKEALELVEEKFQLKVPEFYKEAKKVFDKQLMTKGVERKAPVSEVVAIRDTLRLTSVFSYQWPDGESHAYGKVELTYEWSGSKKEVRLKYQEADVVYTTEQAMDYIENPLGIIEGFGEMTEVSDIDEKLVEFKTLFENEGATTGGSSLYFEQTIPQSGIDHSVGRNISIEYGAQGKIINILAFINDNRE